MIFLLQTMPMKTTDKNSLGVALRTRRKILMLTQKALAAQAGTTEATVSHLECGIRKPSAELLARLARVLSCTTDDLLAGEIAAQNEDSPYISIVTAAMKTMTPRVQEQLADYAIYLRDRHEKQSRRKPGR
jgi:transcriptional regulator with XRE-family HTH domain